MATSLPSNFLFFDSETLPEEVVHEQSVELHRLRLGWAIACRMEGDKTTRHQERLYHNPSGFWEFLETRLDTKRPLWVLAHNLAFDLGTVRGWDRLASKCCRWERIAVDPPIFYLKGTYNDRPIVFCDSFNYYRCSLATVGRAAGFEKWELPSFSDSDARWRDYCHRDAEILQAGILSLVRFWREQQLGPWGATISSLAFGAYRSKFMDHRILVHGDQVLKKLERASYYGGRVDTPLIGKKVKGPVFECDVNSMYPWACLQNLPTHPEQHVTRNAHLGLRHLSKEHIYIADVEVKTDEPIYPCRVGDRVYYPTGMFRTALADAELRYAVSSGNVRRVFRLGVFGSAPIFRRYVEHFHSLKETFQDAGNEGWRVIAKSLLTNLYGKTGQQSPRWETLSKKGWQKLEGFHGLRLGTLSRYYNRQLSFSDFETKLFIPEINTNVTIRSIWGQPELSVGKTESRDSCPGIAACVTSRARLLLVQLQRDAGPGNHFYSDTDSVWTGSRGVTRLRKAGHLREGILGQLCVKSKYPSLIVYGRKDYDAGTVRRLKGIRDPDNPIGPGVYQQLHFPSIIAQLKDNETGGVLVRKVIKRLSRVPDHCIVGPGGWTRPLEFPGELPDGYHVDDGAIVASQLR
ncbi:MAG: DNA polymerase [Vicinamibacteria bacterium]